MRSIALALFSFSLVAQPGLFRPESSSFEDLCEAKVDDFDVIWSKKDERLAQWAVGRWRQSIRAKERRNLAQRRRFEIESFPPAPPPTPTPQVVPARVPTLPERPDPDLLTAHQVLGAATLIFGAYLTFRK